MGSLPFDALDDAWSACSTADGCPTLHHRGVGQSCHTAAGAWREARERYALACDVAGRAAGPEPVRLLDVGTGLGLNVAAALAAAEGADGALDVVTLEADPRAIRHALALGAAGAFPAEVERCHAPVRRALGRALAEGGSVPLGRRSRLALLAGDARETLVALDPARRFDVVFHDPFSLRVAPELWGMDFLVEIARRMRPGAVLATYSTSLTARARLAAAGLRVGAAPRACGKSGTLASPDVALPPLDPRTARRVARRALEELGARA